MKNAPQHCIKAIAGQEVKSKVCAFNNLWWWRKGNRLEIRYCSYTRPLGANIGRLKRTNN